MKRKGEWVPRDISEEGRRGVEAVKKWVGYVDDICEKDESFLKKRVIQMMGSNQDAMD